MINNRLKKIADYISTNDNFIDVGCDHAFLSIYLIENKHITKAIASDINTGPLNIARNNIKKHNLEDKIITKVADGIDQMEDFVNTIIISGMGGITISEIIKKGKDKLTNIKKIVISPNNEFKIARKTISEYGYYIKDEVIIKDKNKYYPIIVFEKGNKEYSEDELCFGPVLLNVKSKEFIEFYSFQRDVLLSFVDSLTNKAEQKKILNEIKRLTRILSR